MQGNIHQLTKILEERFSAFLVARLILLTGIPLRNYNNDSPNDPEVLKKIEDALPSLLTPGQLRSVYEAFNPQPKEATSTSRGTIFRITQALSAQRSPFFLGRLILRSGVNVRDFQADTPDDLALLQKLKDALRVLLTEPELAELYQTLESKPK
jgi:hypothetical protein